MKYLFRVVALIVGAGMAHAQGLVTVTASPPIARATGATVNGAAFISWQAFTTATGVTVSAGTQNVQISSGVFTTAVQLYPNVGATPPGTSYRVTYTLSGGPNYVRNWYIPATSSVTVQQIEFPPQGLVGQTAIVSPAQLTQAGATTNQALCWNGAFWAPGSCGGGGGGGGTINSGLINQLAYYAATGTTVSGVGPGTSTTVLHGGVPSYGQVVGADIANGTIDVTTKITGIVPSANGGSGTSTVFTPGSVVFSGISGVYSQDNANFFWDSGNHRLGIGTTTPSTQVEILNAGGAQVKLTSSGGQAAVALNGTSGLISNAAGNLSISSPAAASTIFVTNGREAARINSNANLLLGTSTDGGFKIDVGDSGSSGTARFWSQTPTTYTRVVFQAGPGQSTTGLVSFTDNSGTEFAAIDSSFQFVSPQFISSAAGGASLAARVNLANSGAVQWSSDGTFFGTPDTGIFKTAAGKIEVNNGTFAHNYDTSLTVGGAVIYNNLPSTGITQMQVWTGAGQSTNAQIRFINGADSSKEFGGIDALGGYYVRSGNRTWNKTIFFGGDTTVGGVSDAPGGIDLSSLTCQSWKSVDDLDAGGTYDTGLCRDSAGVLAITTGTAAAYRDLKLRNVTLTGITGSTQCLHVDTNGAVTGTGSDCGSGSTGANTALSNLASVSINTALLAQTGVDLGSTVKPFRDAYIVGSGTFGTNYFKFTGLPTAARTITIPDFTANLAGTTGSLTSGNGVQIDASGRLIDAGAPPNNPTIQAACTGAATSNVNLVIQLYPPTTCTVNSVATANSVGVLASRTGTLRNLRVHADVGGINASSGVVTVNISGVGATTLTCTLGTGTTCSDTTHSVAITAGQLATLFMTTQVGETLAGLNFSFEY